MRTKTSRPCEGCNNDTRHQEVPHDLQTFIGKPPEQPHIVPRKEKETETMHAKNTRGPMAGKASFGPPPPPPPPKSQKAKKQEKVFASVLFSPGGSAFFSRRPTILRLLFDFLRTRHFSPTKKRDQKYVLMMICTPTLAYLR